MRPLFQPLLLAMLSLAAIDPVQPVQAHGAPAFMSAQRAPLIRARLAKAGQRSPIQALALDMRRLEALYRRQGNETAIITLYQELLKRTDRPALQAFAKRRLRHAERLAHPEETMAKLRARIDQRLADLR